jgi:hypothetical protein
MSDTPTTIRAQAGIRLEFQIAFADVDDSTDPATETPVDLTGCSAVMEFRSRDGVAAGLSLAVGTGLEIIAEDGLVNVSLTASQTGEMAPSKSAGTSGRFAFKLDIIDAGSEAILRGIGFLEVEAWDE